MKNKTAPVVITVLALIGIAVILVTLNFLPQEKTPAVTELSPSTATAGYITYGCANPSGTLQSWGSCALLATPTGDNYTAGPCLIDNRDGKTYEVRKFSDGQCWLATNLAYGGETAKGDPDNCRKTTITDTNNARTARFGRGTYGDCRLPADNVNRVDESLGYLYNWAAAVQSENAVEGVDYLPENPVSGLCPAGWRLPASRDFANLPASAAFFQPGGSWNAAYAGFAQAPETLFYTGDRADYWTSDPADSYKAHYFLVTNTNLTFKDFTDHKNDARAIRCIKTDSAPANQTSITLPSRYQSSQEAVLATTSYELLPVYQSSYQDITAGLASSAGGLNFYQTSSQDSRRQLLAVEAGKMPDENATVLATVDVPVAYDQLPDLGAIFKIYTHAGLTYVQINNTTPPTTTDNFYFRSNLYRLADFRLEPIITDASGNFLSITDSTTFPNDMKFLRFTGGASDKFGELYYYLPVDNYVGRLLAFSSPTGEKLLLGISRRDEIIYAAMTSDQTLVGSINALTIDPFHHQISNAVLLTGKNLPYSGYSYPQDYYRLPAYDVNTNAIYIDSQGTIYVIDLTTGEQTTMPGDTQPITDQDVIKYLRDQIRN